MTHRQTRIHRPRLDNDLDQAGATLQSHSNQLYINALHHLRLELTTCDGFPERGDTVNVRASAELTSVEAHADARIALEAAQDQLRAAKADVLAALVAMNTAANSALRMRAPRNPVQPQQMKGFCRDAQQTKYQSIEWGDPNCFDLGIKQGLCQRHYDKYRQVCIRDDQWGKIEGDYKAAR